MAKITKGKAGGGTKRVLKEGYRSSKKPANVTKVTDTHEPRRPIKKKGG